MALADEGRTAAPDLGDLAAAVAFAPVRPRAALGTAPFPSRTPLLADEADRAALGATPVIVGAAIEAGAAVEAESVADELATLKPTTLERERTGSMGWHVA